MGFMAIREILHKLGWSVGLGLGFIFLAACAGSTPQAHHQAGLVVIDGQGNIQKVCVDFSASQINGLDLLQGSGLDYSADVTNPLGVLVCRIGQQGCQYPQQSCFCQCKTGQACLYWTYFVRHSGQNWVYAVAGASSTAVLPGDVNAWVWPKDAGTAANPPEALASLTFDQVCSNPTAAPGPPS